MISFTPGGHRYLRLAGGLLVALLLLSACGGGGGGGKESQPTPSAFYDEKAIFQEAGKVQAQIVTAIESGDAAALLQLLEQNVGIQLEGGLDLASPEMQDLARAVAEARPSAAYPGLVFYEATYGGETLSFYLIQEEGVWKLGGL